MSQLVISEGKTLIALDRFIQELDGFIEAFVLWRAENSGRDECLSANVEIVRSKVVGWVLFDRYFFFRRKLAFELGDNLFGQLAFDCEDIGKIANVEFSLHV